LILSNCFANLNQAIFSDVLEELFPEVKKKEVYYTIGQRFIRNGAEYILCKSNINYVSFVGLVKLNSGNCWSNFIEVEDVGRITLQEMQRITEYRDFKLVT
jgi:hypothetical protein